MIGGGGSGGCDASPRAGEVAESEVGDASSLVRASQRHISAAGEVSAQVSHAHMRVAQM